MSIRRQSPFPARRRRPAVSALRRWACALPALLLSAAACTTDEYDKGEGEYSQTTADFVEIHANAEKRADYAITDDGDSLRFLRPAAVSWFTTPDSVYRALLYYNKVWGMADLVKLAAVGTVSPHRPDYFKNTILTDPVYFESAWTSRSGKYLNLGLRLMTGGKDDKDGADKQLFSVVSDTILVNADSTRTQHLRLYHSQGGQPEYYSANYYISIRTSRTTDTIRLSVNTYDRGVVTRVFPMK